MTKKQYLKKLEYCIQALPAEERNEALEYYSDYFDDADDDDKVMQELGEPEDLAKTIQIINSKYYHIENNKLYKEDKKVVDNSYNIYENLVLLKDNQVYDMNTKE